MDRRAFLGIGIVTSASAVIAKFFPRRAEAKDPARQFGIGQRVSVPMSTHTKAAGVILA